MLPNFNVVQPQHQATTKVLPFDDDTRDLIKYTFITRTMTNPGKLEDSQLRIGGYEPDPHFQL
jgi:hypothetical protein